MAPFPVTALHIYPVKSMRGISLASVDIRPMGFVHDRRWMLVDQNGKFLSQRDYPALATFTPALSAEELSLTGPDGSTIGIPLAEVRSPGIPVTSWKNSLIAGTVAPEIDAFLSDGLNASVRLVRIPESAVRPVDQAYGNPTDHVSFADGYPVLVTCSASLEDLNTRLREPVPMNRFRPNVVLQTGVAFEEDTWTSLEGPGTRFRLVKPCDRCVIITTDQTTGRRADEPLKTLASYRHRGHGAFFGMNCIPDSDGTLSVGEELTAAS